MKYVFFVLGLLVLSAGCTKKSTVVDCSKILDSKQANLCLYNQSINKADVNGCKEIMDEKLKADCIDKIAIVIGEFYACRSHEKKSLMDACEIKVGDARKNRP